MGLLIIFLSNLHEYSVTKSLLTKKLKWAKLYFEGEGRKLKVLKIMTERGENNIFRKRISKQLFREQGESSGFSH